MRRRQRRRRRSPAGSPAGTRRRSRTRWPTQGHLRRHGPHRSRSGRPIRRRRPSRRWAGSASRRSGRAPRGATRRGRPLDADARSTGCGCSTSAACWPDRPTRARWPSTGPRCCWSTRPAWRTSPSSSWTPATASARAAWSSTIPPDVATSCASWPAGADVFTQGYRGRLAGPPGLRTRGAGGGSAGHRRGDHQLLRRRRARGACRPGWEQMAQTVSGMVDRPGRRRTVPALLPPPPATTPRGISLPWAPMAALWRRAHEGGSYHVRASLCQTARWFTEAPVAVGRVDRFRRSRPVSSRPATRPTGGCTICARWPTSPSRRPAGRCPRHPSAPTPRPGSRPRPGSDDPSGRARRLGYAPRRWICATAPRTWRSARRSGSFLHEHLVGEFAELGGRGGSGDETFGFEVRRRWEKVLAGGRLDRAWAGRSSTVVGAPP